jgi:hypothetical protein
MVHDNPISQEQIDEITFQIQEKVQATRENYAAIIQEARELSGNRESQDSITIRTGQRTLSISAREQELKVSHEYDDPSRDNQHYHIRWDEQGRTTRYTQYQGDKESSVLIEHATFDQGRLSGKADAAYRKVFPAAPENDINIHAIDGKPADLEIAQKDYLNSLLIIEHITELAHDGDMAMAALRETYGVSDQLSYEERVHIIDRAGEQLAGSLIMEQKMDLHMDAEFIKSNLQNVVDVAYRLEYLQQQFTEIDQAMKHTEQAIEKTPKLELQEVSFGR